MSDRTISADCHIDMTWMPGDLWVKNAPARTSSGAGRGTRRTSTSLQ